MKKLVKIVVFLLIFCPLICAAHGVEGEVSQGGGIIVTARYDTGEPMNYAEVKIMAPNSKIPFQIGRTDRNGRFCFFPDVSGVWKVIVDDGIGHRLEMSIPVGEKKIPLERKSRKSFPTYLRVVTGILAILGVFTIILWFKKLSSS